MFLTGTLFDYISWQNIPQPSQTMGLLVKRSAVIRGDKYSNTTDEAQVCHPLRREAITGASADHTCHRPRSIN